MKLRIILFLILALNAFYVVNSQELKVDAFTIDQADMAAQAKGRNDSKGNLCALVKVALASPDAKFYGDIVGDAPEYREGEYWVYMSGKNPSARILKISVDGFDPLELDFADYDDIRALKSGVTYRLVIEMPSEEKDAAGVIEVSDDTGLSAPTTPEEGTVKIYEYHEAQVKPQYPGGDAALVRDVSSRVNYPEDAMEAGVRGRVYLKFVVTDKGEIGEVRIDRPLFHSLDLEAANVLRRLGKKFTPGQINGKNVNVWYTLPLTFKLR